MVIIFTYVIELKGLLGRNCSEVDIALTLKCEGCLIAVQSDRSKWVEHLTHVCCFRSK